MLKFLRLVFALAVSAASLAAQIPSPTEQTRLLRFPGPSVSRRFSADGKLLAFTAQ